MRLTQEASNAGREGVPDCSSYALRERAMLAEQRCRELESQLLSLQTPGRQNALSATPDRGGLLPLPRCGSRAAPSSGRRGRSDCRSSSPGPSPARPAALQRDLLSLHDLASMPGSRPTQHRPQGHTGSAPPASPLGVDVSAALQAQLVDSERQRQAAEAQAAAARRMADGARQEIASAQQERDQAQQQLQEVLQARRHSCSLPARPAPLHAGSTVHIQMYLCTLWAGRSRWLTLNVRMCTGCLIVCALLCRALRSWSLNCKNPGVAPNCSRLQHRRCVAALWRQRSPLVWLACMAAVQ